MTEFLVIGSGLSAVGAICGILRSKPNASITVLDAGFEPEQKIQIEQNLYDYCANEDAFELMIGRDFGGLRQLSGEEKYLPARLTTPGFSFVASEAERLLPLGRGSASVVQSLANGGLANAWGAGSYRFTPRDLDRFPISVSELSEFYDQMTNEIGLSGTVDDLLEDFGSTEGLQPPLELSLKAQMILRRYERKKQTFKKAGIRIGRPRYAILSRAKDGRRPLQYQNLEFWQPHLPEIYTPAFSINRWRQQKKISYQPGLLVHSFVRSGEKVEVSAREIASGAQVRFQAQKLILAAGAIGSSRIVLASHQDFQSTLPLVDNPAVQIPLVFPTRIGAKLETRVLGSAHLSLIYDQGWNGPLQGGLLELSSPARAEFFGKFPLAGSANLALIRSVLPAMMVNLVFFPSFYRPAARVQLRAKPDGSAELDISADSFFLKPQLIERLVASCRLFGGFSHRRLVVEVPFGGGVHYAGTLPMRENPRGRYECSRDGELHESPGVYVVDGACFPCLPAKNHSFTLTANAMRIGSRLAQRTN